MLRRPSSAGDACIFPGHACPFPVFHVVDRVTCCARAAGQVCRPVFFCARPAAEPGAPARSAVDRARARPAVVGLCARVVRCCAVLCGVVRCCAVLCGVVRCCAVLCGVVRCCAVLCGRARPGACRVLPCVATRPRTAGVVCKSMGMPAPARGRERPRTSPREPVHERRPAQLGRRRDACTSSATLESLPSTLTGRLARRPS